MPHVPQHFGFGAVAVEYWMAQERTCSTEVTWQCPIKSN
ncbi:uncharacterized protein METZ01_LOCUS186678, partial [marine metagenome]